DIRLAVHAGDVASRIEEQRRMVPMVSPCTGSPTGQIRSTLRGFLAEVVAAIYPELATHTPDGDTQTLRYQELIPMMLNELQREHQEVSAVRQGTGGAERPREIRTLIVPRPRANLRRRTQPGSQQLPLPARSPKPFRVRRTT